MAERIVLPKIDVVKKESKQQQHRFMQKGIVMPTRDGNIENIMKKLLIFPVIENRNLQPETSLPYLFSQMYICLSIYTHQILSLLYLKKCQNK